jgi:hypothetical protein
VRDAWSTISWKKSPNCGILKVTWEPKVGVPELARTLLYSKPIAANGLK